MARTSKDSRTTYLPEQRRYMTVRHYMNGHAFKHGVIALAMHGWYVDWRRTSANTLCVVATKPAAKLPTSQGWRPLV